MTAIADTVGFVGLGNMGSALATNLVSFGCTVVCHDAAGPERNVDGATFLPDVTAVAQQADVVILSLPDGDISALVAGELVAAANRRATHVIDTSTIGPAASQRITGVLAAVGVAYVDAPVSGGPAGARSRKLAVIYSGSDEACTRVEPVLAGLSDVRRRVGERPGLAQAVKLANNFLSATALAATSEAIAFGVAHGLDMSVMLEALNASSGYNSATSDKFPNHVVTGTYASGFTNSLMAKDLRLYLAEVAATGGPNAFGDLTCEVWQQFAARQPSVDFTRIYPFVKG
jgi:3-hydroxyisobutyrate dehydrogenase